MNKNKGSASASASDSIYEIIQFSCKINIPSKYINNKLNMIEEFTKKIKYEYEGKCSVNGYIKTDSCEIDESSLTSGQLNGEYITFGAIVKCLCFNPVKGMILKCVVTDIIKSGIKAKSSNENVSPFVLYVPKEIPQNASMNEEISKIETGNIFEAEIVESKFEIKDDNVVIIAKYIKKL